MSHDLNHVAIIMDGNNRWAKSKGLSSKEGHKEGVKKAKFAVEFALENKIKFLTLFAFSTENWLRDKVEVKNLLSKLNYKNDAFVHRDFHVSNFMYHNKKIAVIDSQDALIGNRAYDLASLIDDVRLKTPNELKEKVFKFYVKTNKKIDLEKFKKDFEILSVLRNLKIIGIFMRLAVRDNKKKYLKLIPYAWEMINHRFKEQNEFNNLMLLLKNNFPKFIR